MSFRHLKSTLKASFLIVVTAIVAISTTTKGLGLTLSHAVITDTAESEVAFNVSSDSDTGRAMLAYRASGRFEHTDTGTDDDSLMTYRGSERGIETVAYRASGRVAPTWKQNWQAESGQLVAYRASGRVDSLLLSSRSSGRLTDKLFAFDWQPYRGSERGIEAVG